MLRDGPVHDAPQPWTPLIALDAVALDTETTGLDARSARLVQLGAVRIAAGRLVESPVLDRLVDPGVPIPPAATAVHGIRDEDVRNAAPFPSVADDLRAFLGTAVVIGHTVGYDMTVLQREHELAGLSWTRPRALDVRVLAEIVQPTLSQYDLERLCAWFAIEVSGRHTALGDARMAARLFLALVPLLRERGIRTLAEAESASRRLSEQQSNLGGGRPSAEPPAGLERQAALVRIDSFAYRHRVRDVMSAPVVTAPSATTVLDAMKLLLERRISSVLVADDTGGHGIVTERDLLRAAAAPEEIGLGATLGSIMKTPLQCVEDDDHVYRALGRMQRLGFRHLAVRSAEGSLVGVVTPRDLLRNRVSTALVLGDHIDSATDAPSLGEAWSKLPLAAASLLADGVDARAVAAVASAEICAMTRRAAELAVERMAKAGKGAPPVRYAVLALGSAGRGESLLAADQDNAIVYEDGAADPRAVDAWFEELGAHIADTLDAAGVPYCKGGVMARNADWRKSVGAWKETIEGWVRRQRPRDLLNVDIFFDAVPVHGVNGLGEAVWNYAFDIAHRNVSFIKLLTELARDWRAPTTLFGGIRTDAGGRVDLKKGGLLPLFTAARVLAIRHDVRERSTPARLTGVARKGVSAVEAEARGIIAAHGQLLDLLLRQQLADAEAGIPLSSRVDPSRLSKEGRDALRASLRQVRVAIDLVGEGRF